MTPPQPSGRGGFGVCPGLRSKGLSGCLVAVYELPGCQGFFPGGRFFAAAQTREHRAMDAFILTSSDIGPALFVIVAVLSNIWLVGWIAHSMVSQRIERLERELRDEIAQRLATPPQSTRTDTAWDEILRHTTPN